MVKFPVTQVLPDIKKQLTKHNRLILQAPPGAGKTTLVPLALLNEQWLADKQIIILEPRRLATRNAAARMAYLLGEKVGETVGYQIRQDSCISKKTRVLVVTEGILTRKLQADPELEGVALVIFDEFHERSIHADLSLAFCLQSQELINEQLKIIIMSATLNTQALLELLSTDQYKVPLITSEGKCYPVEVIYQNDNSLSAEGSPPIERYNLLSIISRKTITALAEHQGNILIFLPGVREIKQLEQELLKQTSNSKNTGQAIIISPLYGDLSKQQQDQAISTPPDGQRKIVLATNIAQTSLTIEGITIVIDSGLQRESSFSPNSGMNALHTTMIAQDSAHQRSGRAGRLSPGVCYRLWTKSRHKRLHKHQKAEILRSDLAPLMLEIAQWGIQEIGELSMLDLPSPGSIAQAQELLVSLQAIEATGKITSHGKKLLQLGLHPRLAHMILTAQALGLAETSCLIAALLTEKDFLKGNNSDLGERVALLQAIKTRKTTRLESIDKHQCQRVLKTASELQQRLKRTLKISTTSSEESSSELTGVLLAFAYPDRIAKLRNNRDQRYLLSNNKGAFFLHQDILASEAFLVIAQLHEQSKKEARIFLAAAISLSQIEDYFSYSITEQETMLWNKKRQKVDCTYKKKLGSIVLKEQISQKINTCQLHKVLLEGVKSLGLDCLPWSKQANTLKQRVQFLHYQRKQNSHLFTDIKLPDFSDNFLLNNLSEWLAPHLHKENSIKQLQSLNLYQILNSNISWQSAQMINELAPEKIAVPSGSIIPIDYSEADSPILAVRLQELFGLRQTPAILKDRYPLLLHLLSPASRPMQVTHDLASFWENTYNEVKKELRGKYKKHYWPDDPLQAQATSRAKRRKPK